VFFSVFDLLGEFYLTHVHKLVELYLSDNRSDNELFWHKLRRIFFFDKCLLLVRAVCFGLLIFGRSLGYFLFKDMYVRVYLSIANFLIWQLCLFLIPTDVGVSGYIVYTLCFTIIMGSFTIFICKAYELFALDLSPTPTTLDKLKPLTNILLVLEQIYNMSSPSDALRVLMRVWSSFRKEEYDIVLSSLSFMLEVPEKALHQLTLRNIEYPHVNDPSQAFVPTADFGNILKEVRTVFEDGKLIKNSRVVKGLKRLGATLLCTTLGAQIGLKVSTKSLDQDWVRKIQREHDLTSWDDYLFFLGDLAITFCEFGYALYLGDSLKSAIMAREPSFRFFDKWDDLKSRLDAAAMGEIVNLKAFCDEAELLLQESRSLPKSDMTPLIRSVQTELSRRVMRLRIELASSGVRKLPFGVLLHGTSGIGKSTIIDHIFDMYYIHSTDQGFNQGLTWDRKTDKYTRSNESYWNGYNFQWALIFDDIAWESRKRISSMQQTSLDEVIQVMNNVSLSTEQAAIEDKGTKPLMARCVVATTNTIHLNAHLIAEHPGAVLRRFPVVITPTVKPEYRRKDSHMLDSSQGMVLDAWTFQVQECSATPLGGAKYKDIGEAMSLDELSDYLRGKVLDHERTQEQFMQYQSSCATKCVHQRVAKLCGECKDLSNSFIPTAARDIKFGVTEWLESSIWFLLTKLFGVDKLLYFGFSHRSLLHRYYSFISSNKYVVAAATIASAIAAYKIFSATSGVPTGSFLGKPEEKKQENIWYRDLSTRVDLVGPCVHTALDDFEKILSRRSLFHLRVTLPEGTMTVRALGIKGQWIAAPDHLFPRKCTTHKVELWVGHQDQGIRDHISFTIPEQNIVRTGRDVVFITHPSINHVRDITKFFLDGDVGPNRGRILMLNEEDTGIRVVPFNHMSKCSTFAPSSINYGYRSWGYQYWCEYTYNLSGEDLWEGSCGSPVIIEHPNGNFIAGIHTSMFADRSKEIGGFSRIFKSDVDSLPGFISAGNFEYSTENTGLGELIDLHKKSPFHHNTLSGHGIPIGSFNGRRKSPTSRTVKSVIYSEMKAIFGDVPNYGAPVMKAFLNDSGEWIDPILKGVAARIRAPTRYDLPKMHLARNAVYERIKKYINLDNVFPVDIDVALNGKDGLPFVNKIDRSTSGGFRFPGKKIQYLEQLNGTYVPCENVLNYVDHIESCYKRGERANVMFDANLKDEAIPQEKIDVGKTRVFTASALDFTIVMRKQFLMLASEIMEHGMDTGVAAGMNCYAKWTELYHRLSRGGRASRASAGDHGGYDTDMDGGRISFGMWVLMQLCKDSGNFSQDDLHIQEGITADLQFPLVNMNGDLIMLFGTNCSGHALTLILNCIVNLIDMYYAYIVSTERDPCTFEEFVTLYVMGDDNLFTTSPDIEFGHTDVQNALADIGLRYTMADKTSESVRYLPLSKVDFLKRTFNVVCPKLVLCPLDEKSIFKMLTTVTLSKTISELEQIGQIIEVANREWAMYGPEIYETRHKQLLSIVEAKPDIRDYIPGSFFERSFGYHIYNMCGVLYPRHPPTRLECADLDLPDHLNPYGKLERPEFTYLRQQPSHMSVYPLGWGDSDSD
jgi:hypothetical protein